MSDLYCSCACPARFYCNPVLGCRQEALSDPISQRFLSSQLDSGLTSLQRKSTDRILFDHIMERTQPLQADLQRHQIRMNGGMV